MIPTALNRSAVAVLASVVLYLGIFQIFFFMLFLPATLLMHPYVLLMGGLQHGPIENLSTSEGPSRSIIGPKWYMWLLLPCDINFHAEHHQDPSVPHYELRRFSSDLKSRDVKLPHETYAGSLKKLFKN